MHKYLRAIGFSKIKDRKELQKILTDIVVNGTDRAYTSNGEKTLLAVFGMEFHERMGIEVENSMKMTGSHLTTISPTLKGT